MADASFEKLSTVDPVMVEIIRDTYANNPGLPQIGIAGGIRGEADQNAAKAGGYSKANWGDSSHNTMPSSGFDFYIIGKNGKADWNDIAAYKEVQAALRETAAAKGVKIDPPLYKQGDFGHFNLSGWKDRPLWDGSKQATDWRAIMAAPPATALAAINKAVPPVSPAPRIADAARMAYANEQAARANPPLPVPRPDRNGPPMPVPRPAGVGPLPADLQVSGMRPIPPQMFDAAYSPRYQAMMQTGAPVPHLGAAVANPPGTGMTLPPVALGAGIGGGVGMLPPLNVPQSQPPSQPASSRSSWLPPAPPPSNVPMSQRPVDPRALGGLPPDLAIKGINTVPGSIATPENARVRPGGEVIYADANQSAGNTPLPPGVRPSAPTAAEMQWQGYANAMGPGVLDPGLYSAASPSVPMSQRPVDPRASVGYLPPDLAMPASAPGSTWAPLPSQRTIDPRVLAVANGPPNLAPITTQPKAPPKSEDRLTPAPPPLSRAYNPLTQAQRNDILKMPTQQQMTMLSPYGRMMAAGAKVAQQVQAQQRPVQPPPPITPPGVAARAGAGGGPAAVQTITGSATGRAYNVGQTYQAGGYTYMATPQGFVRTGQAPAYQGMSPSQQYAAASNYDPVPNGQEWMQGTSSGGGGGFPGAFNY